jgi:hypothetical protein
MTKKTKGLTLMELFTAAEMFDVCTTGCQKNFFGFPVAVNNSIKVGPLVSLL